jgi:hypothetical protein
LIWLFTAIFCGAVQADESLVILPTQFNLNGSEARQTLIVERSTAGQFVGQAGGVSFTSSDADVVRIKAGVAVPVGNGKATITAKVGDRIASAQVTITGMEKPVQWSFRNDVQPILTKFGCNSGACHGALAGENGFKLSLRGYDNDGDFRTLTRHALGRRIIPSEPGRSLFLLKPTAAVAHKGGERFTADSAEYRVLAEWIADGTPPPRADDPVIQTIEIVPAHAVLKPGDEQQIIVLAHFSDGSVRDITRLAKYNSVDSGVANIGETGQIKITGSGEGTITAWYQSKNAVASVTVPYGKEAPAELFASAGRRNFVDDLVLEKLRELNLPPSPPASDSEFIRRVYIDTIGVLPTAAETRSFLADASPDKRDKVIESLLARPEFVDYWSYKWSDLLLVSSRKLRPAAMWTYYNWIRDQVAANTPWDQFARQLVTAKGSTLESGAANFYILHDDPTDMSETLSVAMLGMSIQCAKCHNHPMEKWTNGQYYAMANLFARVRLKGATGDGNNIIFSAAEGELIQPLTGKPQLPSPLDGTLITFESTADRREHFADWLVSRQNPYFSRAITNRVWANFMAVGLVEKVDDMRLTNPASNEKLLNALANYLADQKFDLKALMRVILQSRTYQRSSKALAQNAGDGRFYSRYYPRRIMAEVLLDAFSEATSAPTPFAGYPEGWRAMQIPDASVESYFLKAFGRSERVITCECERTADPSMAQVLNIANGDTLNAKLAAPGNRIDRLMNAKTPDEQIVEEAYVTALSRPPTEKEKTGILSLLKETKQGERRQVLEDLYWSILSSNEFLFNH